MSFQNVPVEKYLCLKGTLDGRLPKAAMTRNVLQLLQDGRLPTSIHTKIYAFEGKCEEAEVGKDVFVVAIQFREVYQDYAVIISAPELPTEKMNKAFEELIDWKHPIIFCAVDRAYSKYVQDCCKKNGILKSADACDFMTVSIPEAKQIYTKINPPVSKEESSELLEIKELSPCDANMVTKHWFFAEEGTENLMQQQIKHIGSAGVYLNSQLVSWVVIFAIGSVNALYTADAHRAKGYARLTMQKLCQIAAERSLVPNVQVAIGNTPSKKLMESIGFNFSHLVDWVSYKPLN